MDRRLAARLLAFAIATLATAFPPAGEARPLATRPYVVAHGGASGYLPEDTLAAYALAIEMGADFIQPTVFLSADGVLVVRHERALEATTDVLAAAAAVPGLRGRGGGYLVDRLTLAELRELRALHRGTHGYAAPGNGHVRGDEDFRIATLRQVLDYVHVQHRLTGRVVGIYLEVGAGGEAPAYVSATAEALAAELADARYGGLFDGGLGNVYLKARDRTFAEALRQRLGLPVVVEAACGALPPTREFDGVSLSRTAILDDPGCVRRAHEAGLVVHAEALVEDAVAHAVLYAQEVDAVYATHPDVGRAARDSQYPLLATPEQAGPRFVPPGAAAALRFSVENRFGGLAHGPVLATLRRVVITAAPACDGSASEAIAYASLEVGVSRTQVGDGSSDWSVSWRMPYAEPGACFSAAVELTDGTVIEGIYRLG